MPCWELINFMVHFFFRQLLSIQLLIPPRRQDLKLFVAEGWYKAKDVLGQPRTFSEGLIPPSYFNVKPLCLPLLHIAGMLNCHFSCFTRTRLFIWFRSVGYPTSLELTAPDIELELSKFMLDEGMLTSDNQEACRWNIIDVSTHTSLFSLHG